LSSDEQRCVLDGIFKREFFRHVIGGHAVQTNLEDEGEGEGVLGVIFVNMLLTDHPTLEY
jgi:hypothetical protein